MKKWRAINANLDGTIGKIAFIPVNLSKVTKRQFQCFTPEIQKMRFVLMFIDSYVR